MTSNKWGAVTKIIGFIQVVGLCLAAPSLAEVVAYPQVPGLSSSPTYSMTVNGTPVPVQSYSGNSFAWFAFSGTANVVVTVNASVSTYTLSPLRNATSSFKSGATVNFSLSVPRKLALHKVNAIAEKLFIFGDALESSPPILGSAGVLNVQTYGADPTGSAVSTTAINNCITAVNVAGGGVCFVPAGLYTSNAAILLKANANLYLAPGAVIKNLAGSYTNRVTVHINAQNNVTISGRGVFYGNGTNGANSFHLMEVGAASGAVDSFTLRDVMLLDSQSTGLVVGQASNATVENVKILSGSPSLSDGIDTDAVTNLLVTRCFIWSSDDNLAPGGGAGQFKYNATDDKTDGYTITQSLFYHTRTGHILSVIPHIGPPYIQNILFENNDSISVADGFAMLAAAGPVDINHVIIRNSRVEEVRRLAIEMYSVDFMTGWGGCANGFCSSDSGKIRSITFDNVIFDTAGTTDGQLVGRSATQNIDTITFNAVSVAGTLATNAAMAHLNIGDFVSNVIFTNVASGTVGPSAPVNLQIP